MLELMSVLKSYCNYFEHTICNDSRVLTFKSARKFRPRHVQKLESSCLVNLHGCELKFSCTLCFWIKNMKVSLSLLLFRLTIFLQSHWVGKEYFKRGPDGNDIHRTNVPHIRLEFREMVSSPSFIRNSSSSLATQTSKFDEAFFCCLCRYGERKCSRFTLGRLTSPSSSTHRLII